MALPRMAYYRTLFYSAVVFNLCVASIFVFGFGWLHAAVGGGELPDVPLLQMFIVLSGGSIFLFGIIYLFAGLRLESAESNLLIALGAIGKLTFFIILLAYALNDVSPWGLVGLAAVDLLYALLFTECLWFKTTQRRKQVVVS